MGEANETRRRVLLTGVTGTIARQLAEELLIDPRVEFVCGMDVGEEPYYFRDLDRGRFRYFTANPFRERELQNLFILKEFKALEVDTVVHTCFIEDAEQAKHYRVQRENANVTATKALLEHCLNTPSIQRFVLLSSHEVYRYRQAPSAFLDEDADLNFDPRAPLNVQDRVDTDMLCRTYMDSEAMDILVIRPSQVIGRNMRGALNRYLESPFCPAALGFDPMINPIHARDVVRVLRYGILSDVRGVFNIAGKELAPLSQFIRMAGGVRIPFLPSVLPSMAKLMSGLRMSRMDPNQGMDGYTFGCMLDTRRAKGALGFEPKYHIKF